MVVSKEGGCNCGAIRYEVLADPLFSHVCHCRECQHDSGNAFNMTTILLEQDFRRLAGEPRIDHPVRKSGVGYSSHSCPECACTLWICSDKSSGLIILRPGSLDDRAWVVPQAHIWVKEKQPWLLLGADIPQFQEHYNAAELWPKASLARLAGLR